MSALAAGDRNVAVTRVAGVLRAKGADEGELLPELLACPERQGLPESEVRTIAKSAMKWPAGERREAMAGRKFRDAIEQWCLRRGFAESALRAMGADVGVTVSGESKHQGEVWFPMHDEKGAVTGYRRRRGDGEKFFKKHKALTNKGGNPGLMGPWPLPPGVVLIAEGEADAVAALTAIPELAVVGTPTAKIPPGNIEWLQRMLTGLDVVLCPHFDAAGMLGVDATARALVAVGCRVRVIPPLPDVKDLDDRLKREPPDQRGAKLRELLNTAIEWRPGLLTSGLDAAAAVDPADSVVLGTDQKRVGDEVLAVLVRRDGALFRRGSELVQLVPSDATQPARLVPLCEASLRERITQHAVLEKEGGEPAHPPRWLVENLLVRRWWSNVRPCDGVVESPTMRADGSILDAPGYDEATCLYLAPRGQFPPLPSHPSLVDAQDALQTLFGLVADVPFRDPAHRTAWLFALLSIVCRPAIGDCVPGFVLTSNAPGVGKGLLAKVAGAIATGRVPAMTPWPGSDDEMRKLLTATVDAGERMLVFDDIKGKLGGGPLDTALTAGRWSERRLGITGKVDGPFRTVVFFTGVNLAVRGDSARRLIRIELFSPLAEPEKRPVSSYRFPDLVAEALSNRTQYLAACLTLVRAYVEAGRPEVGAATLGNYESACCLLGGALVWAGAGDPLDARKLADGEAANPDLVFLAAVHDRLAALDPAGRGVTSKVLADDTDEDWRGVLADRYRTVAAHALSMDLTRLRDRQDLKGRRLASRKGQGGLARWFVEPA